MKKLFATLALASVASFAIFAADEPTKVCVFQQGENGSQFYRIPALIRANDNSLVAVADQRGDKINDLPNTISVVCKRSTDNGDTWSDMVTIAQGDASTSKTYGDPAIVKDAETGTLMCIYSGDTGYWNSTKTNRAGFYYSLSTDNGVSWTEPTAFTDQVYQSTWRGAFAASGRALQLKSGRIMFVASAHCSDTWGSTSYCYVCYTDDLGKTWHVANPNDKLPSAADGNESKLVELENGDLIMSIRTSGHRRFVKSTDGGATWGTPYSVSDLPDPSCNGDIIRYSSSEDGQSRLLHSIPASTTTRQDVSVFMSYDEGSTWRVSKKLIDTYSAYSSLEVLEDGSIGCLVEEGKWDSNIAGDDGFDLYFMRFSLDWLTDGSDNGEESGSGNDLAEGVLDLDGSRYMRIPNSTAFDLAKGKSRTISMKVKPDASNDAYTFFSNRVRRYQDDNNGDVSGIALYGTTSTKYVSASYNFPTTGWKALHNHFSSTTINDNEWHNVCWTFDGLTATFYLDGKTITTTVFSSSDDAMDMPSYDDILIGTYHNMVNNVAFTDDDLCQYFVGEIDDVRIYDSAFTADEVTADAESDTYLEGKSVVAAYNFSNISGSTVPDITGNGHDGILVGFPEYSTTYTVTIETPDASQGTLKVYNGYKEVTSGAAVAENSVLTIEATPVGNYTLKQITVNGEELEGSTYTVTENCTIAAVFESEPYAHYDGTVDSSGMRTERYINTMTVTDGTNTVTLTGYTSSSTRKVYKDQTDVVLNTNAGKTLTFTVTDGNGVWSHTYVYIDYNNDGVFTPELGDNCAVTENSELVSFNCYSTDGTNWYNSVGTKQTTTNLSAVTPNLPTITLPTDLANGSYRVRYKVDWNCIDPYGNTSDGNHIAYNSGTIIDFMLSVDKGDSSAIEDITINQNAPVEYFNLNGVRVSGNSLTPGVYITRQGSQVNKLIVK